MTGGHLRGLQEAGGKPRSNADAHQRGDAHPMSISINLGGFGSFTSHTGSSPEPFDAVNGHRLAGPQGSHPLHSVTAEELLRTHDDAVVGEITLDRPAMVGEGITGMLRVTAVERIDARKAALRLVGLRLDEVRRSHEDHDSDGHVTHTDDWVETDGTLFIKDAFPEPAIPAGLQPGGTFESRFAVPAPQLGPPTAHLGESIVAWALEVRWDVPMGSDHFVATYLPLAQHPDLLRAGVGKQGGMSLLAGVPVGDAMIGVTSELPAPAGSEIAVTVRWPSAPGGSKGRVELHRRTNAPNGEEGIVASVPIDPATLKGGAEVQLVVPAGSAPSFDGAGLEINYVIRVLVDRRFMSDAAIERPVAIV
jgi:hypothetical protein